jgi:hypothetical protein
MCTARLPQHAIVRLEAWQPIWGADLEPRNTHPCIELFCACQSLYKRKTMKSTHNSEGKLHLVKSNQIKDAEETWQSHWYCDILVYVKFYHKLKGRKKKALSCCYPILTRLTQLPSRTRISETLYRAHRIDTDVLRPERHAVLRSRPCSCRWPEWSTSSEQTPRKSISSFPGIPIHAQCLYAP